jgi:hypothetical protein
MDKENVHTLLWPEWGLIRIPFDSQSEMQPIAPHGGAVCKLILIQFLNTHVLLWLILDERCRVRCVLQDFCLCEVWTGCFSSAYTQPSTDDTLAYAIPLRFSGFFSLRLKLRN